MAFNIKATMEVVRSHFSAEGKFEVVSAGEPKQPPGGDISMTIMINSIQVVAVTAAGQPRELHNLTARIYKRLFESDEAEIEYSMAEHLGLIMEDIVGDYSLGGNVNHVDIGGIYGTPLQAIWGHITMDQVAFRTIDLILPIIVDGSSTASA